MTPKSTLPPRLSSRRAEFRLLAGFAAVPPTAGLVAFAAYLALFYAGSGPAAGVTPAAPHATAASLALGVALVALLVTVFGAVPGVSWLTRRGPLSLRSLLVLGAGLGDLPFAIIVLSALVARLAGGASSADITGLWQGARGATLRLAIGAAVGAASAAMFWLVAVRGTDLERAALGSPDMRHGGAEPNVSGTARLGAPRRCKVRPTPDSRGLPTRDWLTTQRRQTERSTA